MINTFKHRDLATRVNNDALTPKRSATQASRKPTRMFHRLEPTWLRCLNFAVQSRSDHSAATCTVSSVACLGCTTRFTSTRFEAGFSGRCSSARRRHACFCARSPALHRLGRTSSRVQRTPCHSSASRQWMFLCACPRLPCGPPRLHGIGWPVPCRTWVVNDLDDQLATAPEKE